MESTKDFYYVTIGDAKKGPYSVREIQIMLDSGKITGSTMGFTITNPEVQFPIYQLGLVKGTSVEQTDPASTVVGALPMSGVPTEVNAGDVRARYARDAAARYGDAYLVARVTTGFGTAIKGIGGVLAAIILFASLFMSPPLDNDQVKMTWVVGGFIVATVCGSVFYLFGVLVAAQGQILMATLDGAVHTSPFLTDEQKAHSMSLR